MQRPAASAPTVPDRDDATKSKIAFAGSKHWRRIAMRNGKLTRNFGAATPFVGAFSEAEQCECSSRLPAAGNVSRSGKDRLAVSSLPLPALTNKSRHTRPACLERGVQSVVAEP